MKPIIKLVRSATRSLGVDIVRYRKESAPDKFPPDFTDADADIIRRVSPYTYTSPDRIWALCNAVRYLVANRIPGAVVECGVWKGGSMMAAMLTLAEQKDTARECYLYDTFEGMSEPSEKDITIEGVSAKVRFETANRDGEKWVYSSLDDVKQNIHSVGYPTEKTSYIKGKVENTIPRIVPDKIALLRLDTDWYESTRHELIHLFPRLVTGGVIIVDDYGHWQGARQAIDEYLAQNHVKLLLNRIDYTGRVGIKL